MRKFFLSTEAHSKTPVPRTFNCVEQRQQIEATHRLICKIRWPIQSAQVLKKYIGYTNYEDLGTFYKQTLKRGILWNFTCSQLEHWWANINADRTFRYT